MKIEKNYDFRQRFDEVHKPNRRDYSLQANSNEFVITEDTVIVVSANEYEMARGENCFDVYNGKYIKFKDYEEYRQFILDSKEIKEKRYKQN